MGFARLKSSTRGSEIDQSAFRQMVEKSITSKIEEMTGVASTIAAAIEQQNAATQEVGQNINLVSDASVESERMAKDTLGAAGELASKADELQGHINSFMESLGVKN